MTEGIQKKEALDQPAEEQVIEGQSADEKSADTVEKPVASAPAKESQLGKVSQSLQRSLAMVSGLVLLLCLSLWGMYSLTPSDPYIQSVLQLTGDSFRGHDIFQLNCATCHGLEAAGEVGPTLQGISERRSQVSLIQQVTSGQTPPMPQFQPNERDMADLLAFLETL